MKSTLRNLAFILINGYILIFFADFLFYGQLNDPGSPEPQAADFLWLLGAYSLMAYLALALIRRFRVASLPALLSIGISPGGGLAWSLGGFSAIRSIG